MVKHHLVLLDVLFTQEAPLLIPSLTSDKYRMKWTQLADLPFPLFNAHTAVLHHKVYVTSGYSPVGDTKHQVFVYNINTDRWGQLPLSGHYYGIPHIIGERLVIIGGHLSATTKVTNKVSTFDENSQTWISYYPDLCSDRSKPGVVGHLHHVIVAGGLISTNKPQKVLDDIEILDCIENSHWRMVCVKLPIPMWDLTTTTSGDHLLIVNYCDVDLLICSDVYKIPVVNITGSVDQQRNSNAPVKWTKLTSTDNWKPALVSGSSPPVIVGGENSNGAKVTADIKMYEYSSHSWKKIGSLSFARSAVAVAAVYGNGIIIIGGRTKADSLENARSSSLVVVELGQGELL